MKFIILTNYLNKTPIRVNPLHIVAYWQIHEKASVRPHTQVFTLASDTNHSGAATISVSETPEEIDQLILALRRRMLDSPVTPS